VGDDALCGQVTHTGQCKQEVCLTLGGCRQQHTLQYGNMQRRALALILGLQVWVVVWQQRLSCFSFLRAGEVGVTWHDAPDVLRDA
jgi:hypothetical protein